MRRATVALALLALACGDRRTTIEKPAPPDMAAVVERYESPDGVFDPSTAQAILDGYADLRARATELGLHERVIPWLREAMDEALASEEQPSSIGPGLGTTRQDLTLEANGTMRIDRICAGWGAEPAADPANGRLTLRVNFTEAGLDPVLWGDAEACQYMVGGATRVRVDEGSGRKGDVRIWIGKSTSFASFGSAPMIFDVDLNAELGGAAQDVLLDFRIDPQSQSLAFAIDAAPGHIVVSPTSTGTLSVVAHNGTFDCDPAAAQCTSDLGRSFSF